MGEGDMKFIDWNHANLIVSRLAKENKSAIDVYNTLNFAVNNQLIITIEYGKRGKK
jgi:hypothetical protein